MLKPFLKEEYTSLCSSQTVVSSLVFGDELQLSAIRAYNRISNTAIDLERGSVSTRGAPSARSWRSRNTDRERPFFLQKPHKQEQRRATETTERGEQEVLTHSQIVDRLNSLELSEFFSCMSTILVAK